jgi:hypothetical protein
MHWGVDGGSNQFWRTHWDKNTAPGQGFDMDFHLYQVEWTPGKNDTLFKNLLKKLLVDKEKSYNINEFCDPNFKTTDTDILKLVSKKDVIRYF